LKPYLPNVRNSQTCVTGIGQAVSAIVRRKCAEPICIANCRVLEFTFPTFKYVRVCLCFV